MGIVGEDLSLIRLTTELGDAYLAMVDEFEAVGEGYPYNNVALARRRRGYASYMLGRVLDEARALGLPGVSLTVEGENLGSVRPIEKHGGRLERHTTDAESGVVASCYWIALRGS